jgi:hypothetical protein
MRRNVVSGTLILIVASLSALTGCASSGGGRASATRQPTATTAILPTETPVPATATATSTGPTVISQVSFTCPATVTGANKTFTDSQTGFSFSYPASWTETQCQRTVTSDGDITLNIGQVFNVRVIPRTGMDAKAWVQDQVTLGTGETVTTTPITVQQAMEAYQITDNPGPSTPDNRPLLQAGFIIMGSRNLYVIYTLIAQTEMQDTLINVPPLQIVQTISVQVN